MCSPLRRVSEVERERQEEFSPLQNSLCMWSDDPGTSRRELLAQQRRYIEAGGTSITGEDVEVEVSLCRRRSRGYQGDDAHEVRIYRLERGGGRLGLRTKVNRHALIN